MKALWATDTLVHHRNVRGWGTECCIWFASSVSFSYHLAPNSLSSPGALLLVGTQQEKLFKYCFLGQLILLKCK